MPNKLYLGKLVVYKVSGGGLTEMKVNGRNINW